MWEGVGDRTELQHIDPHSYDHNSVTFPFSWCPASLGGGFLYRILTPARLIPNWSDPQMQLLNREPARCWLSLPHLVSNWLNFLCTELYNSSTHTFFLWTSQIALIQPVHGQGYIMIFLEQMHLLFTLVHFLFWQPGRVVGQYTAIGPYQVLPHRARVDVGAMAVKVCSVFPKFPALLGPHHQTV